MTYVDKPTVSNVVKLEDPNVAKVNKLEVMLNTGTDIYQGDLQKKRLYP